MDRKSDGRKIEAARPGGHKSLQRDLKPRHLQLIALGGIIGSGYFLGTGQVLSTAGPATVLSYLLGGAIIVCVMLCLGELAVFNPVSSSFVTYSHQFISPAWACGVGWSYWTTWVTYVPAEMIAAGIIMESFVPGIDRVWWSLLFGAIITIINLIYVKAFGEIEFWLSIIKISAIALFVVLSLAIGLGIVGERPLDTLSAPWSLKDLLPFGLWPVVTTMTLVLVNFQGAEIIGLAAGETEDPAKNIAVAVRNIIWRIVGIYFIPLVLLITIFPWQHASIEQSVFAAALNRHGLSWAGGFFSFVVLTAAVSCSNSGLYGCTRAIYGLGRENLAPAWLARTNRFGVPHQATLFSITGCWIALAFQIVDPEGAFVKLLAISGFSGAIAWISICWSQLNFRRQLPEGGPDLKFKVPLFPYLTHFGIWSQVACLLLMVFSEPLRELSIIGMSIFIVPMIWYFLWGRQ